MSGAVDHLLARIAIEQLTTIKNNLLTASVSLSSTAQGEGMYTIRREDLDVLEAAALGYCRDCVGCAECDLRETLRRMPGIKVENETFGLCPYMSARVAGVKEADLGHGQ